MKGKILYIGNQQADRHSTPSLIDRLSPRLERRGYELITASGKKQLGLRALDMAITLGRHLGEVDRLLIDTYSTRAFHYAWIAGAWARKHQIPYYPILHGGNLESRMRRSPALCQRFFGRSQENILVSDFLAPAMKSRGFSYRVIPNGLDLECFPFLRREKARPRLLWVRAFSEIYQPGAALDLVQHLLPYYPDIHLIMVGPEKDGSLDYCKRRVKESGWEDKVEFTGPLTQQAWAARSQEADLFINTSRIDNMPVSLLEAMALGLPVVSLRTGGIPRMLVDGKEGALADDLPAMAEAIRKLIDQPAWFREMAEHGRRKAIQFGWPAIERQWEEIWEKE